MPNILRNASGDLISKRSFQRSPTILNVSKNILARESIFRNIDCNIAHDLKKKASQIFTQQQIKQSSIYQRMLMRLQRTKQREQQQKIQHQRRMKQIQTQILQSKQGIKQDKLQIWELRNQIIQLEEVMNEEMQEYQFLWRQMQRQMQSAGLQMFMPQQGDEGQYDQNEYDVEYGEDEDDNQGENDQQTIGDQQSSRNQQSEYQESSSKPTCSIKIVTTERSITTPDLQKMEIHSGLEPFSNQNNQYHTYNCMRQQQQKQEHKHQRILSFKKSQHIFTKNF